MTTLAPTSTRSLLRRGAVALLAGALALGGLVESAAAADDDGEGIGYRLETSIDLTGKTVRSTDVYTAPDGRTGVAVLYADGTNTAQDAVVATYDRATLEPVSSYRIVGRATANGGAVTAVQVSEATGNHIVLRARGLEVRDPDDGTVLGSVLLGTAATAAPLLVDADQIWFTSTGAYRRYSEQDILAGAASPLASITPTPSTSSLPLILEGSGALLLNTGNNTRLATYDRGSGALLAENTAATSDGGQFSSVSQIDGALYAITLSGQTTTVLPLDPATLAPLGAGQQTEGYATRLLPGIDGTVTLVSFSVTTYDASLTALDAETLAAAGPGTVFYNIRSGDFAAEHDPSTGYLLVRTPTSVLAYVATADLSQLPDDDVDYGDAIVGKQAGGGALTWGIKESWRQYLTTGHAASTASVTLADDIVDNGDGTYAWPGTTDATGVYDSDSGEFRAVYDGSIHYYAYYGTLDMQMKDPTIVVRATDSGPVGTLYVSSATTTDVPLATLDLSAAAPTTTTGDDGLTTVSYTDVPATYIAETGSHFFLSFYQDGVALDPLSFSFTVSDEDARWVPVGATDPGAEEPGTEEPGTEEPGTEEPGTEEPGTEEPGTEEPSEPTEGVTLEWSGSAELQAAPPFGGSNYFTAGVSDGTEGTYRTIDGDVEIVRDIGGTRSTPSYATRAEHINQGAQIAVFSEGVLSEHEGGGVSVKWDGSLSVNFYGGLVPFTLTDPVLEVAADGTGTLVADLSGYASDMANPTVKEPTETVPDVTVATFSGVDLEAADGYTITPDYAGVTVEIPADAGASPQNREVSGWGSWPQEFVDYQLETGLSSYWYSSGGAADSRKAPYPFAVALNGNGPGAETPTPSPTTPITPPAVVAPPEQPTPSPDPTTAAAPAQQTVAAGALPVAAEAPRTLPADSEGLLAEIEEGTIPLVSAEAAGIDGELEAGSTVDFELAWDGEDAGGTVWAYSTPVEAGAFTVAEGRAIGTADLTGLEPGEHHLVLSGDAGTVVAIPITIAEVEEAEVLAVESDDAAAQVTPISVPASSDPLWFVAAGLGGALLIVLLVGILLATGTLRLAPTKRAATSGAHS